MLALVRSLIAWDLPQVRRWLAGVLCVAALPVAAERNVILLIGDGMDDHQITIARNYLAGAQGRLSMDDMPLRSAAQVLTISEDGEPVYVSDSANTATALATGEVTSRGRIATRAGSGEAIETIVEIVRKRGLHTGLVSTSSVTDATMASFAAHINRRFCENPQAMEKVDFGFVTLVGCPSHTRAEGGAGSIAEQLAVSGVDVLLGGGLRHFNMPMEGSSEGTSKNTGPTVLEVAEEHGYQVVTNWKQARTAGEGKLLGLFAPSHLPVRLRGENGRTAEAVTLDWGVDANKDGNQTRPKQPLSVSLPPVMRCEPNPDYTGVPSLKQLTDLALKRLENDKGFFLMVESASIDKQAHERKPCGSIGELAQLDEALDSAMAFAARRPETLVLVTADHAHAAQLVPERSLFAEYGVPVYTPGRIARIRTPEGAILAVNYATNDYFYEEHTGAQVPVFANREGIGRVPPMLNQPDLFNIMLDYLQGGPQGE